MRNGTPKITSIKSLQDKIKFNNQKTIITEKLSRPEIMSSFLILCVIYPPHSGDLS